MKLPANSTLLFIGDSITDCGRTRPVGQLDGLGDGYVSLVDASLETAHPDIPIQVMNTGIGGNRVTDLQGRWQTDGLDLKPNWLSVMIGINDVWRQFDSPGAMAQVSLDDFRQILDSLLTKTRSDLDGLILMTPYCIESLRDDPMRSMMDTYSHAVRELAEKHNAIFVDTQAAFDNYLAHRTSSSLAGDRIHPNRTGHMIIARAFLDAVVC